MRRLLPLLVLLAGCEWVANPMNFTREEVPRFKAQADHPAPVVNPTSLKVMAWNVKYGACRIDFWFDFWGDRVQMSSTEVTDCLTKVAALIREYDPDILMTEEIEVDSKRSAYIDMVSFLLENTNLRYAAYMSTWDSRYVPSEGVGRMNLGNAIFSRYPITKAESIRQVDRTDQDVVTGTFYIKRVIGRAEVDVGNGRTIAAYVVHTEAYDQDGTKQKHIQQIHDVLRAETLPWVIGGDFNELPPVCDERAAAGAPEACDGKLRLSSFLDERESSKGTEFEQPPYTPSVMKPFYEDFEPFIPLARYGVGEANQRPYFTHSMLGPDAVNDQGVPGFWNRTLDYLFIRKGETWTDTDVIQEPGRLGVQSNALRLSDHAPVAGTWRLP
ncbi:endonuclease/exonuclease/phosphatase family protein [Archangium violaceum]|uniref:endonuclease/exonuclease/phosphatase family protein n=1 Tax=Archangium violaceum TaxID=83451 RepID=UPI0019515919|nr:endonuclease/exonuclease/phosphatase family protein [Archangium violaceum]QRN98080.1 endonuclease/exonuclease/phosphatase family protein [Archangium violaceum]